jgi:hypothetical protein
MVVSLERPDYDSHVSAFADMALGEFDKYSPHLSASVSGLSAENAAEHEHCDQGKN